MKTYGYVNTFRGEDKSFLDGKNVEEIVFHDKEGFNFSFAEKGDLVFIKGFKSIAGSLKELLEFSQFICETGINVAVASDKAFDTSQPIGKLMISMWASLNKYDDECFIAGAE